MSHLKTQLNEYLSQEDNEFNCYECDTLISHEGYCSRDCHKASNI